MSRFFAGTPSFGSSHGQALPFRTTNESLRVVLMHGNLDIWIHEARNLPNMDVFHKTLDSMITRFGKLSPSSSPAKKITSDPYVTVAVAGAVVARTYVVTNSENPSWEQHFNVPVAHRSPEIHFVVKDNDVVGSQIIGAVGVSSETLLAGKRVEGVFPIVGENTGATLRFSVQYTPAEQISMYRPVNGSNSEFLAVQGTYFPLRKGGRVTLYQDADCGGDSPAIELRRGVRYERSRCWRDVVDAIKGARRLVYIVGWSVYHNVKLTRGGGIGGELTLGDLLKAKSQEGVRVLLLVWDDPTSTKSILGYKKDGIMGTNDEETRRFFKNSSVQLLLCPRSAGKGHSFIKQREVGTIYTHHQKTVIVDADAGNHKRQITAFIGGLDLCKGRYDTPSHPIFRGVEAIHTDDFHNPNLSEPKDGCPREPWHDLHSRVEGPAAYDILQNFEERWLKASKQSGLQKLKSTHDDSLLRIDRISDIIPMSHATCLGENDPESWNVQIFRSIDSGSVKGFPKDPREATNKNLMCGKNILIDMSIHTAYVKAIRSAQHFIYIENQYFLGSSYNWRSTTDLGANNLIPMEIALKIVSKIKANERFCAYIIIPMWPEGDPTSIPIQRILFWQNKTMQMMYEMIYEALKETGLDNKYEPQDYLNFFCLGNREAPDGNFHSLGAPGTEKSPQALTRKYRRFMIYVHSKGMIVDDEYVIIGSANINQRSLEGTRDTEIAMGSYQPHHTWARRRSSPNGQIYGYRMSLWAEHIGGLEESFKRPESVECVRRVRSLSEQNWRQFIAEEVTEMTGHLLKYPVEVDRAGRVNSLPDCKTFPDLGGNILGTFTGIQENLTI